MSKVIFYTDFIESIQCAKNTALAFKDYVENAKIEYDKESSVKKIKIMFFGYSVLLNGETFLEKDIVLDKNSSSDEIYNNLHKELERLMVSRRLGNKMGIANLYLLIKDFQKSIGVDNVISIMNNNNGVFMAHNDFYSIGVTEQIADNELELGDFVIDLSK